MCEKNSLLSCWASGSLAHKQNFERPYRVYSCPEHRNGIHVNLLWREFSFHDEIRQQRYS